MGKTVMGCPLLWAFVLFFACSYVTTAPEHLGTFTNAEHRSFIESSFKKPTLVAQADGKKFYIDEQKRDWLSSKNFCETFGMKLAKITSDAQCTSLLSAADKLGHGRAYWTAAREPQRQSAYIWSGYNLPSDIFQDLKFDDADYTYEKCLQFLTFTDSKVALFQNNCDERFWERALCEA